MSLLDFMHAVGREIERGPDAFFFSAQTIDTAVTITDVDDDSLAHIMGYLEVDNWLAFSLSFKRANLARRQRSATIRTHAVSTVRTPALLAWGQELGCPWPYPHWAWLDEGLKGRPGPLLVLVLDAAHRNSQKVRVNWQLCHRLDYIHRKPSLPPPSFSTKSVAVAPALLAPLAADALARCHVLQVVDEPHYLWPKKQMQTLVRMSLIQKWNAACLQGDAASSGWRFGCVANQAAAAHTDVSFRTERRPCLGVEIDAILNGDGEPLTANTNVRFSMPHATAWRPDGPEASPLVEVTLVLGRPFEILEALADDPSDPTPNHHGLAAVTAGLPFDARVRWIGEEEFLEQMPAFVVRNFLRESMARLLAERAALGLSQSVI